MNRSIAIAAIAFAAASSAFAEGPIADTTPFVAAQTRSEVQAELQQYKAARVNPWSTSYNQLRGFQSTTTRAQVTADYLKSRNETAALTGEDSGSAYLAQHRVRAVGSQLAGKAPAQQ